MTKAITIIALACLLVAGAAATSILGRDSVPSARADMASPLINNSPVANRESKQDKLAVTRLALASFDPQQTASLSEPLRQAYASAAPDDIQMPKLTAPTVEAQAPKPKAVALQSRPCKKPTRCSATSRSPASRNGCGFPPTRNITGRRWKPRCAPWPGRSMPAAATNVPAACRRSIPTPPKCSS